jgi:NDP-sugar pyrophosphorylase family protein
MIPPYRKLTPSEIEQLGSQACTADDWDKVLVHEDFSAEAIRSVHFSGDIKLGKFEACHDLPGNVKKKSGIRRAHLHNCEVGNNVLIENIGEYIANYVIEDNCCIEQLTFMICDAENSFGNGVEIEVLDETGGRVSRMYNGISAHTAYLMAMYPGRTDLQAQLKKLTEHKAMQERSAMGRVGHSSYLINAGMILNVNMGPFTKVRGSSFLYNGSINSTEEAPVQVGAEVNAQSFIFSPGSEIKDGVHLVRCFVGEASILGHGFTGHDSFFFANCRMENGEACASFAGPFSTSMHKSTLMIGGLFSFCNFGSGSNQSNHLYKLGPMHSGVLERGTKTGSDSYLLWPAKIGPFSLVKGRHVNNPDTTAFPFSYLVENRGMSYLIPAASLPSIGLLRDVNKWPDRDLRKSSKKQDKIIFHFLNPNTVEEIRKGIRIGNDLRLRASLGYNPEDAAMQGVVSELRHTAPDDPILEYRYRGMRIRRSNLEKGSALYKMAIQIYVGDVVLRQIEAFKQKKDREDDKIIWKDFIKTRVFEKEIPYNQEKWLDIAGLVAPEAAVEYLIGCIERGKFTSVEQLEDRWEELYQTYQEREWAYAFPLIAELRNIALRDIKPATLLAILDEWQEASLTLCNQAVLDAELELSMKRSFAPEEGEVPNSFVEKLRKSIGEIPGKGDVARQFIQDNIVIQNNLH